MASHSLSNLQLELLKLYSTNVDEKDLKAIKSLLAQYFARRASKRADEIWDQKKFSNKVMDDWLNEG